MTRFLVGGHGSGMAGMTTTQALRRRLIQAAAGPLWFLLSSLNLPGSL